MQNNYVQTLLKVCSYIIQNRITSYFKVIFHKNKIIDNPYTVELSQHKI